MPDATVAPDLALPAIWPKGIKIPVIGAAGELNTGKTLFGLTIDPVHTRVYDMEKSSESYIGLGFDRVDVPFELLKIYPNGYSPLDLFTWLVKDIRSIPAGQFSVIMIDPITDPEVGLVDYVKANPEKFGKTATQYDRASGLLWGDVKNFWKSVLLDFTARCQTFYFTTHMRQVWKGNSPTSRREPQGKDTLAKLASLYLLLNRDSDGKGSVPEKPRARVLKDRLSHAKLNEKGEPEITPILPPMLAEASPAAIRKYILAPPKYKALKAGEKIPQKRLSDDDKLELKAEIARNEVEVEQMKAGRFEQMEQAAKILKDKQATKKQDSVKTVDQQSAAKPTDSKLDAARATDSPPSASSPFKEPPIRQVKDSEKAGADLLSDEEMAALKHREFLTSTPPPALADGSTNPEILAVTDGLLTLLELKDKQRKGAYLKREATSLETLSPEWAEDLRSKSLDMAVKRGHLEKN